MNLKNAALIILVGILTSCTSFGRSVPLPIPVKPVWPTIKAADFECVSSESWHLLDKRNVIRDGYELELINILKSTHEQ